MSVATLSSLVPYVLKAHVSLLPSLPQGEVWICMELLDTSMDKLANRVYHELHSTIPENIVGKMTVSVSSSSSSQTPLLTYFLSHQVIKALSYLKTELKIIHRGMHIGDWNGLVSKSFRRTKIFMFKPFMLSVDSCDP